MAGPVDQVDLGGGDGCDRPLLSDAAVAGLLNDRIPLVGGPVDRLETLAVLGAHELDDLVFGLGRRATAKPAAVAIAAVDNSVTSR